MEAVWYFPHIEEEKPWKSNKTPKQIDDSE
jgi:hypothetical protein